MHEVFFPAGILFPPSWNRSVPSFTVSFLVTKIFEFLEYIRNVYFVELP